MVVTVGAAIAAAGVLYLVFRAAQERISSQTLALVEATRRDPFTGMLNHGALVETIGAAIERLRGTDGGLEIAILDIDNFRILNDTWGHAAGDEAIRAVQAQLEPLASAALAVGRYGPDEFLVVVDGEAVGTLERRTESVRRALADVRSASATATTCRSPSAAPSPGSPRTATRSPSSSPTPRSPCARPGPVAATRSWSPASSPRSWSRRTPSTCSRA